MRGISRVPGRQSRRGHKNNPSTVSFEAFEKENERPAQQKEQDGNSDTENIHEILHTSERVSVWFSGWSYGARDQEISNRNRRAGGEQDEEENLSVHIRQSLLKRDSAVVGLHDFIPSFLLNIPDAE